MLAILATAIPVLPIMTPTRPAPSMPDQMILHLMILDLMILHLVALDPVRLTNHPSALTP